MGYPHALRLLAAVESYFRLVTSNSTIIDNSIRRYRPELPISVQRTARYSRYRQKKRFRHRRTTENPPTSRRKSKSVTSRHRRRTVRQKILRRNTRLRHRTQPLPVPAKMLRQSFRRSFRRLTNARADAAAGESSNSQAAPETTQRPPPPDYATVLVEINRPPSTSDVQPPDVVPQASAFSHVSTLVRNSFRRAMRNNEQSTSSERLVDTDVNNRAYIIPRLVDTDKPNGNV
ncbi:unnamed protein product [Nesidiocoris tenuis]|uniref:Uncharacterized protein n=1 Tax=Nesidiocoris tenuis TaxID=355587 RepID=A0A6H5GHZ6_9HEMI|nr:unnamed protein product [Nesidiocoris tenuis]